MILKILLQSAILIPLICGMLLLFPSYVIKTFWKKIAVIGFVFPLLISIVLWTQFFSTTKINGYAFVSLLDIGFSTLGLTMKFGLNGLSLVMLFVTSLIGCCSGRHAIKRQDSKQFLGFLLIAEFGAIGMFCSINIIFAFLLYGIALIVLMLMVFLWGKRGRKITAFEMSIVLTVGAFAVLLGIVGLSSQLNKLSFDLISTNSIFIQDEAGFPLDPKLFFLLLMGVIAITATFPLHSWSAKIGTALPMSLSMICNGVLRTFGIYVSAQISMPVFAQECSIIWYMLVPFIFLNTIFIGVSMLGQKHIKCFVNYLFIIYMGYCLLGCFSNLVGIGGSIVLMFGSCISMVALGIVIKHIHSRTDSFDMKEMLKIREKIPLLYTLFILGIISMVGFPGFVNFWGLLSIFTGLWEASKIAFSCSLFGLLIIPLFVLIAMFPRTIDGKKSVQISNINTVSDITVTESAPVLLLLVILFLTGIFPSILTKPIEEFLHYKQKEQFETYAKKSKLEYGITITNLKVKKCI